MRVMNVFPIVASDRPHVWRIGKLFLVIVLVEPRFSPTSIAFAHKLDPRTTIDSFDRFRATDFEQTGCNVNREHLLWHNFSPCQTRIAYEQRDADARFVCGSLINHAVLAFEQAIVTHEYNHRIIELSGFL